MAELTLTIPEAAEALGISPWLVRRAVRDGTLPHIQIGRRVLIPRKALDRWLTTSAS